MKLASVQSQFKELDKNLKDCLLEVYEKFEIFRREHTKDQFIIILSNVAKFDYL